MNLERHHRKIRAKTHLLRWTLAPLAVVAGFAWLYLSVGTCQEEGDAVGSACRAYSILPFVPTMIGLGLAALIVWDLTEVGMEAHHEKHGVRPEKRKLHHAVHGLKELNDSHRRHVHLAILNLLAVTVSVGAWIAWQWWQSTR